MKTSLLFAALLISLAGIAQNKGDNTIIVNGNISNDIIKKVLFMNGYALLNNDTVYLSTSAKDISQAALSMKLMILKTDSAMYIKGLGKSSLSLTISGVTASGDFSEVYYTKVKGHSYYKAWGEMDKIAKLLSSNVTYAKQ